MRCLLFAMLYPYVNATVLLNYNKIYSYIIKLLTRNNEQLACKGEIGGVFRDYKDWSTFSLRFRNAVWKSV